MSWEPPGSETGLCPVRGTLTDFVLGKLSSERIEWIGRHLSLCEPCGLILASLEDTADVLVRDLRRRRDPGPYAAEAAYRAGLAEIEALLARSLEAARRPRPDSQPFGGERPQEEPIPPDCIGRFQVDGILGQGGFGVVYRAFDPTLKRQVALKLPRAGRLLTPEHQHRFLREAAAAAGLDHPHIVPVYEVGQVGSVDYIVSAYCPGITLAEWIREQGASVSPIVAAALVAKLADAAHHGHTRGIVHRDLKPGNVMMDAAGEPHVMDFGLAKRETGEITMTAEGQVLGTRAYMSPEQARGDSHLADRRSDVYSLGVILFELLTGVVPFRGDAGMLIVQIVQDEPPPLRRLNSAAPGDLETICLKCLEKSPDRRFQTAAELADELRRFSRGEPIRTRPISTPERAWRWCRRNPLVAGLCAALLVVLLAGFAGVFVQWRRAEHHADLADQRAADATRSAQEATRRTRLEAEAREETRIALYNAGMLSLEQLEEAGDYSGMLKTLEMLRPAGGQPDLRDFAWRHWWTRLHQHSRIVGREIHGDVKNPLRLSPDVRAIAWQATGTTVHVADYPSGANLRRLRHLGPALIGEFQAATGLLLTVMPIGDKTVIHYWDAAAATLERTLETGPMVLTAHDAAAPRPAISADGSTFVCRRGVDAVDVWNLVDQRLSHEGLEDAVEFGSLSADGRVLATVTSDGVYAAWDLSTGARTELQRLQHPGRHEAFATPDGRLVVCASGSKTIVRQVSDGQRVFRSDGWPLHTAVSGDGATLAFSGLKPNSVILWDVRGATATFDHRMRIERAALSHDGSILAAGGFGKRLYVWDVPGRKLIAEFPAFDGWVHDVLFSRDGQQIVACDNSGGSAAIKTWEVSVLQNPWRLRDSFDIAAYPPHTGATEKVSDLEFSPDGTLLVSSGNDAGLTVWDVETGRLKRRIEIGGDKVSHFSLDPSGKRVAATALSPGQVKLGVWELDTGREIKVVEPYSRDGFDGVSFNRKAPVAFLEDGRILVTASELDRDTKLWDADSLSVINTVKHPLRNCNEFAPIPGSSMFVEANTFNVILRDSRTGRPIEAFAPGGYDVAVSRDGKLIAAGTFSVQVWETATRTLKHTFAGHGAIKGLAFSPDGRTLAVSSVEDVAVRLFNLRTNALVSRFEMPGACYSLTFSPDGSLLACGCQNGTIRMLMASSASDTLELLTQRRQQKLDRTRVSLEKTR